MVCSFTTPYAPYGVLLAEPRCGSIKVPAGLGLLNLARLVLGRYELFNVSKITSASALEIPGTLSISSSVFFYTLHSTEIFEQVSLLALATSIVLKAVTEKYSPTASLSILSICTLSILKIMHLLIVSY